MKINRIIMSLVCIMSVFDMQAQPWGLYYYRRPIETGLSETPHSVDIETWKRYYIGVGWQFNIPIDNDFADKANGWGAYVEGGYYFMPNTALGGFVSYNTNNEYIPRRIGAVPVILPFRPICSIPCFRYLLVCRGAIGSFQAYGNPMSG